MSKMVERTLDFLELFAEHKRPLQLTEISRLVKTPISSCHDVLRALEARGYIYELAPRAGYYPTLRLLDIARTIADHDPVATRAEIVLRELRDSTDETVLLCKTDGAASTYLLSFEPSHALRFMVRIGESIRNLYATSAGKALVASWDAETLEAFLADADLIPLTPHTITTAEALRADIDLGRRRGWFLNREESIEGLITLSAPFLWNGSQFIVTIAAPASRIGDRVEALAARLLEACAALEMRTGPR
jgi:DNA-binding IclR family transcriptional regulator